MGIYSARPAAGEGKG